MPTVPVTFLDYDNGFLWIGSENGLARWNLRTGQLERLLDQRGWVRALLAAGDTLWLAGDDGLLRASITDPTHWEPVPLQAGWVRTLVWINGTLWIGTDSGLFRWNNPRLGQPQRIALQSGAVFAIQKIDHSLWIGAEEGLFELRGYDQEWKASIEYTSALPSFIGTDSIVELEWAITNFQGRTSRELELVS